MIEYLRTTTDDIQKADVVKRIGELAERFAPDTQWFIDTMNQVLLYSQLLSPVLSSPPRTIQVPFAHAPARARARVCV